MREALKEMLLRKRRTTCEGRQYKPHDCVGGPDLHEVFIKRNDCPRGKQEYLWNEINCALVCRGFHARWGHTREFTLWFTRRQIQRYGERAMGEYLENAPLKAIPGLGEFL